ncbi:MAG: FAD binding domain-containing protein [Thermoanaerobaculia bacterium]
MTQYSSPSTLAEAVEILDSVPGVRLVAGCTDLMVGLMSDDADAARSIPAVMNVLGIRELSGIRERDGFAELGAASTFTEIRESNLVREKIPALAAAASEVGGWQIQNRATLGGNVVNASPAGDSLPVLMALDARAVAAGAGGEREIPYAEFHSGYRQTALEDGELLAWLRVPIPESGTRQFFRKVGTREAQSISKVVVALAGRVDAGKVADYRLSAGSVAPVPIRFPDLEREMIGREPNAATADWAGREAAASVTPIDDVRSTAEYRSFALEAVVRRLTLQLFE